MRSVLDTNVFVSGLFWSTSPCRTIINKWCYDEFVLVSSLDCLEEWRRVISSFKIHMPPDQVDAWEEIILSKGLIVEPREKFKVVLEDPDDDKFFEAAVEGKAKYVVSQDKKVLKVREFRNVSAVLPKDFLTKLD